MESKQPLVDITASPLPPGWEQFLDLRSGRIYYVNKSTEQKTCRDPRSRHVNSGLLQMKLDINNNNDNDIHQEEEDDNDVVYDSDPVVPSSYNVHADDMIATACWHCHMLVMMSKVSLQCPNCKRLHNLLFKEDPMPRIPFAVASKKHSNNKKH